MEIRANNADDFPVEADSEVLIADSKEREWCTKWSKKKKWIVFTTIGIIVTGLIITFIIVGIYLSKDANSSPHPHPEPEPYPDNPYIVDHTSVTNSWGTQYELSIKLMEEHRKLMETPYIDPTEDNKGTMKFIPKLKCVISSMKDHLINIKIRDEENERFEVPIFAESSWSDMWIEGFQHYNLTNAGLSINSSPFGLQLKERESGNIEYSTFGHKFRYMDRYIEWTAEIPTHQVYGMGERVHNFTLLNGTYTLWNKDNHLLSPIDDAKSPGKNLYGSHPFYMAKVSTDPKNPKFIGVFMRNANAQEFSITYEGKKAIIKHVLLGGILDIYIFHSGKPSYIIQQYHQLIGKPYLPPFWSMGYNHMRWGWKNISELREEVESFNKAGMPLDSIWPDIDIMDGFRLFTVDNKTFPGLRNFSDYILELGIRVVPNVDCGFKVDSDYNYYKEGVEKGLFIMSNYTKSPLKGKVWPGETVWLDYQQKESKELWMKGLQEFWELVGYSGVELDMNEIASFVEGEYYDGVRNTTNNEYSDLEFTPGTVPLNTTSVSLNAYYKRYTHPETAKDTQAKFQTQYNTHSLFSLEQTAVTHQFLRTLKTRIFILPRSTSPGSGHFASHWLGDNHSKWEYLQLSIPGILNFQLFGIPHVGADICGYSGNATEELAGRWFQLGAFYPLMRTQSEYYAQPYNNPMNFGGVVEGMARGAIYRRYSILRFYYTQMWESHEWGGAVVSPLFYYYGDEVLYKSEYIDTMFMIGAGILVVPIVNKGETTRDIYLPNDNWYNLTNYELIRGEAGMISVNNPFKAYSEVPLLVRGGIILPVQSAVEYNILRATDLLDISADIIIFPNKEERAEGRMVADDGISLDTSDKEHRHYDFVYSPRLLKINILHGWEYTHKFEYEVFTRVIIANYKGEKVHWACMLDTQLNTRKLIFKHVGDIVTILGPIDKDKKIYYFDVESITFGGEGDLNMCHDTLIQVSPIQEVTPQEMNTTLSMQGNEKNIELDFRAVLNTDNILNIKISKKSGNNWKVPGIISPEFETSRGTKSLSEFGLSTTITPKSPFSFNIEGESRTEVPLISTKQQSFIYYNNFKQLRWVISGSRIFGIGERVSKSFELPPGVYTMFARDAISPVETGHPPGNNMYGQHPMYIAQLDSPSMFIGVFILNSNPIDFKFEIISPGSLIQFDHLLTGEGILDVYIIKGTSINHIIQSYHMIIGNPIPIPFWALGYQQCRWGYVGINRLKEVYNNFTLHKIPLDVLWTDIDYMTLYQDFTLNEELYPGMGEFMDTLHQEGRHFVPILDAGISRNKSYDMYTKGMESNLYIKSNITGDPLLGIVWPGYAVYTDFLNPNSTKYWSLGLSKLQKVLNFDGIWIDMNECSNFCDGECPKEIYFLKDHWEVPVEEYDNLPYIPGHQMLNKKGMSLSGMHNPGGDESLVPEMNVHSMYGHYMVKATREYMTQIMNKRSFIISRSTFAGTGKYGSHWLGDNWSQWPFIKHSISGVYNFHMFGIPYVGPDICGFIGDTTWEMCSRWIQVGTFYPFARNHNNIASKDQEPYLDPMLMDVYKHALAVRYSLIRYYYTLYMGLVENVSIYIIYYIYRVEYISNPYSLISQKTQRPTRTTSTHSS